MTKTQANEPGFVLDAEALEAAAKASYEYEGDRREIDYLGWSDEPENVRRQWLQSVRLPVETYCAASAAPIVPAPAYGVKEALEPRLTIAALQRAHVERQEEWCPDQKPDLSFRGNEMAGEVGEACNVIKKLERERHGWRGSRATIDDLGDELADTIHTAILCAMTAGIDLEPRVFAKFNATSEKNGLATRLSSAPVEEADAKARPSDDQLWDQTLAERDNYHDAADKLAEAIGELLGVNVGEHSSAHSPWETALEHAGQTVKNRVLVSPPASTIPSEPEAKGTCVPDDVRRLVIAAQNVAFDDAPSAEALKALDDASEAFAARVPWENEP